MAFMYICVYDCVVNIVWQGILSLYGMPAKVTCCAEIDMVVNISPGR